MNKFDLIISDSNIFGGKPIIKGTRISVEMILEFISSGASIDNIVKTYPYLSREAITQAINYAKEYLKNEILLEIKTVA